MRFTLTPTPTKSDPARVAAQYQAVRYNHPLASLASRMAIAIYPGSFDPITLGHLDIIERGCLLFERVIVVVLQNPSKTPMFVAQKRVEQISQSTGHLSNVEVDSFDGLTVTYARMRKAECLLRGLRVLSDFEKELQMAHTNKTLADDVQTVFLATSNEYSFLSSSLVKEIARFGGSIDHLVPPSVALDIHQCYAQTPPPPAAPIRKPSVKPTATAAAPTQTQENSATEPLMEMRHEEG